MFDSYHIRNDGKEFPVQVHYYFRPQDVYKSLETVDWLLENSKNPVDEYAIDFIAWYIVYVLGYDGEDRVQRFIDNLPDMLEPISTDFVKDNKTLIEKSCETVTNDFFKYSKKLNTVLNQEFIRCRIGGMYETSVGGDMYFRVSSTGFNWYPIIWDFVNKNKARITTVSILRDPESTGVVGKYYSGLGAEYRFMPVDAFLTEKGNPVIEFDSYLTSVRKFLLEGGVLITFRELLMNPVSAESEYRAIFEKENKEPRFWYKTDEIISRLKDGKTGRDLMFEIK